jgi:hypothetical protein
MRQPRMTVRSAIVVDQDIIPGAGPRFDLVGTSRMVVVRETPGVTRTTCRSGSSPTVCTSIRITVTL